MDRRLARRVALALAGLTLGAAAYACGGGGGSLVASSGADAGGAPGADGDGGASCPTIRWLTRISGGGHDVPTALAVLDARRRARHRCASGTG